MNTKHFVFLFLLLSVLFLGKVSPSQAAGLNFLIPKKVEADPKKEYHLSETDGPWFIVVYSFSGDTAREDANALVLELRKKYKLNAYLYDKVFEFRVTDGMREAERKQRKNEKYVKTVSQEYAVLVGNFQSMDDPAYLKALQIIKRSQPDCLKKFEASRIVQVGMKDQSPLALAFGTPNPLLPPDFFNQKGVVDSFVEKLNSDSPYSLLNNPGRYTVRVATFKGNMEIRQYTPEGIVLNEKEEANFSKSGLAEAGATAATLCKALRLKGYEAYEFHDRYSSIVTVGAFDDFGTQGPQGMIELRSEINQIYERFRGNYVGSKTTNQSAYMPKSLSNIEFDIQPTLIEVPKRQRDFLKNMKNQPRNEQAHR